MRTRAVSLLGVVILSGCGGSGGADRPTRDPGEAWAEKTGSVEMLDIGLELLENAASFRARLVESEGGTRVRSDIVLIDDRNCFGNVRIGANPSIDVTVRDGVDYVRTTAAGWEALIRLGDPTVDAAQATAVGQLYGRKWVHTGQAATGCREALDFFDGDSLRAGRKRGIVTVGGVRGALITVSTASDLGTALFSLAEPHHLLRLATADGTAVLSEHGADVEAPLPPQGDRIDPVALAELAG